MNDNQKFNLNKYHLQVEIGGCWTFTKKHGYKCTTDNCQNEISPATVDYYLNSNKGVDEFKCYQCQENNK